MTRITLDPEVAERRTLWSVPRRRVRVRVTVTHATLAITVSPEVAPA